MKLTENQLEVLLASVLSVNGFPLDRIWQAMPGLRAEGLTDPARIAEASLEEIIQRLDRGGHNRGGLAGMMAERVQSLMQHVHAGHLDELPANVGSGAHEEFVHAFCAVRGVGPRVADLAWQLLRGTE